MFWFDEKEFQGKRPVKYVLEKEPGCDKLLAVFSGFNSITLPIQHTYNYMRSLADVRCNKLFILDGYGPRGCYYMVESMCDDVETSVIALIDQIAAELGLARKNVIAAGSSKGGSAALYYGMKYGFGSVIAGAPQTKIANYVTKKAVETADYMLGKPWTLSNIVKLNKKIYDQINYAHNTKIYILSSENDWQYRTHVKPFLRKLKRRDVSYEITLSDKIANHSDIGNHYPAFLLETMYGAIFEKRCEAGFLGYQLQINAGIFGPGITYRFRVEGKEECLEVCSDNPVTSIEVHSMGAYKLTMDVFRDSQLFMTQKVGKYICGGDLFDLKNVHYEIEDTRLHFMLDVKINASNACYSFYLLRNKIPKEKIYYLGKPEITFDMDKEGLYRVQWYIHLNNRSVSVSDVCEIKMKR